MKFQDKSHWTTAWLSDVVNIYVSSVDKHIVEGETIVPVCNYTDVYYNDIITSKIAKNFRLGSVTDIEKQKFSLYQGDVIITKDSETANDIGIPTYIAEDIPNLVCGYHLSILRAKQTLDSKYLSFALQTSKSKYTFYRYANGITRFGLTQDTYKNIPIALPPLEEQKEIAHILSKQDEYIDKLNQLIQAKEKNFLGLIQTLITDRVNEWGTVQASNIMDIRDGTHDSPILLEKGVQFVTSKNIKNFSIDFENVSYISLTDSVQINKRSAVEQDDILFSMIGTIGEIALIDFKPNFCIKNVGLFKHNKQKILPYFLLNYFQTSLFKKMILKLLNGGIQKFLSLGALRKLQIPLPPLEEQERIANILSIAQSEISKLKELKSKHQQQKLALMQEIFG